MKHLIAFMIIFSLVFNYTTLPSYACSCAESLPVKKELQRSSAVFSGEVIEMLDDNENSSVISSDDPIAVLFKVEESWKEMNQTEVAIYTARSSASCGFEFALGNEYLVYADETDGEFSVNLCSNTKLLSSATDDIQELGEGKKPTEQTSIELTNGNNTNNYIYIALLAVGLLVGGIYMTRRLKR